MTSIEKQILELCDSHIVFKAGDARVVLIENRRQEEYRHMFGFWKFSENDGDNNKVFDEMEKACKSGGIKNLIGPVNYSSWFDYRIALDNFDLIIYPDTDGSLRRIDFLERRGYIKIRNYTSKVFEAEEKPPLLERVRSLGDGYRIVTAAGHETEKFADINYDISLQCFEGAFLYTPISIDDYRNIYLETFRTDNIDPFVVHILHNGEPVAFEFSYKVKDSGYYILKTAGIKDAYRNNRMLLLTLISTSVGNGFRLNCTKFVSHYRRDDQLAPLYGDKMLIKNYGVFKKNIKA